LAYINLQVYSIRKSNSDAILKLALDSSDARVKAAGCVVACEKNYDFIEDLIESVAHDDELVRQASRQSLVLLSSKLLCEKDQGIKVGKDNKIAVQGKKSTNLNAIDFGPILSETSNAALNTSQNMWKVWFKENLNKKPIAKD